MDPATGNESISELFTHKYNALYNSLYYNTIQLNNSMKMNASDIMTTCSTNGSPLVIKHLHSVSVNQLQYAIKRLKSSKSDYTDQLFSDHFINGTVRFYTLISLLFTCMLSPGVSSRDLLLSTMVPVPKDKLSNKSDSSNGRAIAISSILGKFVGFNYYTRSACQFND